MTQTVEVGQGAIEPLILKTLSCGPHHSFTTARWNQDRKGGVLRLEEGSVYASLREPAGKVLVLTRRSVAL